MSHVFVEKLKWFRIRHRLLPEAFSKPCSATVTGECMRSPGVVTNEAAEKQRKKHSSLCVQYYFVPIAVESLGVLGEEAREILCANVTRGQWDRIRIACAWVQICTQAVY